MNKYLIVAALIAFVFFIFYRMKGFAMADANIVKEKIQNGAKIFDVRTPEEFNSGHYPGAINIPVDQISKRIQEFGDKSTPIVIYCASGGRSSSARNALMSVGFTDVTNAGGLSSMPK